MSHGFPIPSNYEPLSDWPMSQTAESRFVVPSTVEHADDRYLPDDMVHGEGNHRPALVVGYAKSGSNVIARYAAMGKRGREARRESLRFQWRTPQQRPWP